MKITKLRVLEITKYEGIKDQFGNAQPSPLDTLEGCELTYAIHKNITKLLREKDNILKANPANAEGYLKEYRKEYKELLESEAKKDEAGEMLRVPETQNVILKDHANFNTLKKQLEEKFKKDLDKAEKGAKEFEKFLESEIEFTFHQVERELIPKNITRLQMGLIFEMIKE